MTEILHTIFLDPIPHQLWFVRDLIVLVLFSPVFYWGIKHLRVLPILLLFVIWLGVFKFSFVIFSREAVFFFCLGAYIAIHHSGLLLRRWDKRKYIISLALWLIIVFLKTTLPFLDFEQPAILLLLLNKISILIGVIGIWSVYDIAMKGKASPNKKIHKLSVFSFFLYAFHEPFLTIIKKRYFLCIRNGGDHIYGQLFLSSDHHYLYKSIDR